MSGNKQIGYFYEKENFMADTILKLRGLMGLQEHDLIMAAKKVSGKTVKKSMFPRLLDKTARTGE